MKQTIINAIKEHKLIAIVRGAEADKCIAISQALYEGGFKAVEITYNMKDPTSWEETAKTIGAVKEAFAGKMIVGAGTVTCWRSSRNTSPPGSPSFALARTVPPRSVSTCAPMARMPLMC